MILEESARWTTRKPRFNLPAMTRLNDHSVAWPYCLLAVLLAGCAAKQESPPWNQPAAWTSGAEADYKPSNFPDDAEDVLTDNQKLEVAKLRATLHPVPSKNPFPSDSNLHALYLDWYGRGYTFTAATGRQWFTPQIWIDDSPERRAKIRAWEDGQFDAGQKRPFENFPGEQSAPHR